VAGKFNEKEILKKIKTYFQGMKKGKKPPIKRITEKQVNPEVEIKFKKTDQTHFVLGNRAYAENHKDRFVLALLSIILGGNMSSRLFIEIREKRGLAYYVKTNVDNYQDCGYLATQAGVEHKNLALAVQTILQEYKKITLEKVSEKELQKAKDFIKGKSVMGLESSDEVAMFFVGQAIKKRKIMTIQEIFTCIDKVTVSDILRVAKDIFRSNKLNLAVVGPYKSKKDLEKLLKL
jgi:predicted Zn-dependent peptidase